MVSMTGYAYREFQNEFIQLVLELKSYNNRYLDIGISSPPFLSPIEPTIRSYLKDRINRGKVEVSIRIKELQENITVHVDTKAAQEYGKALGNLAETLQLEEGPRLSHYLRLEGIFKPVKDRDIEWMEGIIMEELEKAFIEYNLTRSIEGEATARDILQQVEVLETNVSVVESHAEQLEQYIRGELTRHFKELVGEAYDENRILSETAVLLMKYSVGEETVRIRSHLEQFRSLMVQEGGVGKKLDFICQELNREINTIGSKSTIVEINRAVVEAKDALEKIREQLRNVE